MKRSVLPLVARDAGFIKFPLRRTVAPSAWLANYANDNHK